MALNGKNRSDRFKRLALLHDARDAFTLVSVRVQLLARRQRGGVVELDGDFTAIEGGLTRLHTCLDRLQALDTPI